MPHVRWGRLFSDPDHAWPADLGTESPALQLVLEAYQQAVFPLTLDPPSAMLSVACTFIASRSVFDMAARGGSECCVSFVACSNSWSYSGVCQAKYIRLSDGHPSLFP